jgi:hypothetical protein
MRWQIAIKGEPILLEPSTYYATMLFAVARLHRIEEEQPTLKGKLEVREAERSEAGIWEWSGSGKGEEMKAPFKQFRVICHWYSSFDVIKVHIDAPQIDFRKATEHEKHVWAENNRLFVESAIREKLEREAGREG